MTKQVSMPMREWNQNENPKFDTNQVHQKEGLGMTTYGPWQTMYVICVVIWTVMNY